MAKAKSRGRVTYTDAQKQSKIQRYMGLVETGLSRIEASKKVGVTYLSMKKWTDGIGKDASSTISKAISGGRDTLASADATFKNLVKSIRKQVIADAIKALQSLQ